MARDINCVKVGDKKNKLTVLEILPEGKIRCLCECGKEKVVLKKHFSSSHTKSCGCSSKELRIQTFMNNRVQKVDNHFVECVKTPNTIKKEVIKKEVIKKEVIKKEKIPKNINMTLYYAKNICSMLKQNNIKYLENFLSPAEQKYFDIVIFKDNLPFIIIKFEGFSNSKDLCNIEEKIIIDGDFVPEIYKFDVISLNVKLGWETKAFKYIIKILDINFEYFADHIFNKYLLADFPYPKYSKESLLNDWNELKNVSLDSYKYGQKFGNKIMTHFHKSVYHSRCKNLPSPFEQWHNPEAVKKCIFNRYIYLQVNVVTIKKIMQGFSINKSAPRVSIFQPTIIKSIIMKYGENVTTVVDPFSGFSGRMLGVSSLGIDYTGYDIRQETIDESNNMINFLNLKNVRMFQQDTLNVKDEKEYDLLITCPPYGKGVERWDNETKILDTTDEYVEKILNNFNAKVYLFIVDKTAKFKDNIIDNVHQRSHFQNTDELILKFIKKC